jgi:acetylornithine deacetylase/succinyl-diaminopimelate desuccinylase-like protein
MLVDIAHRERIEENVTVIDYNAYFKDHREAQLEELKELLRIPSVSALSEHKGDVRRAAEWIKAMLERIGMEHVELHETEGHPILYADWLHKPGKPTVLIYGHYDVQPVDPLNLWDTPPFEPSERDGKLFARGATDDKGQLFLHLKAIEALHNQEGELPVNVKFCIEGEEEITSTHLYPFVEQHKEKLAADAVLISDGSIIAPGKPSISIGLRGLCSFDLHVTTANTDLHSGTYGGGVPNANHALVELLNSFHDEKGHVYVRGFYDDVPDLTPELAAELAKEGEDEELIKEQLGLDELYGEAGYTFTERTGARPTLEINGMYGGFQGEGTKTVIPREAHAKCTCRLVGHQDPQDILDKIARHVKEYTPIGAHVEFEPKEKGRPFVMEATEPMLVAAAAAYADVYREETIYTMDGGSIPIVESFSRELGAPVVLMNFGLHTENLHAPNEHFHLENFDKGLRTIVNFLKRL